QAAASRPGSPPSRRPRGGDMFQRKRTPEEWQALFALALTVGFVVVLPCYLVVHSLLLAFQAGRFLVGQLGRPFGGPWFQYTQHRIWQTNFIAMPPDDEELTRWFGQQPGVVKFELRREPDGIVFDCVRRGYFLQFSDIQGASTAKARS